MNGQGFYQQQSQPQQQQQRQCPPQQNIATANGGAAVYSSANLQNYQQTYATGFQGVGIYAQAGVDNAYYHHQYANVAFPNYSVAQQQGCYSTAGLVSMIPAQQQQHHQQPMYFTTAGQQHCYPVAYSPVYYQQPTYQDHRNDNLLKQIEFYFSSFNLKRDNFLRQKMDSDGYIPLILICGLPKVAAITGDLTLISQLIQRSSQVELSADGLKARPRNDWILWSNGNNNSAVVANNNNAHVDDATPIKDYERKGGTNRSASCNKVTA